MRKNWVRRGLLVLGTMLAGTALAGTALADVTTTAYDWPELHGNQGLTGYAASSSVSASNAAGLGVKWGTNLFAAMLDSPVVAYDPVSGKTLAYIGTDSGNFDAVDRATGAVVWSVSLHSPVRATPLVSNGVVWVAASDSQEIYKLNAATGATLCTAHAPGRLYSSPVAATPPGGKASVYFAAGTNVFSVSAATCAIQWTFTGIIKRSGVWDPLSYAVTATNVPIVLFGSANPDDSVYAVNALTGAMLWHYATTQTGDNDIGSGVTVSPPGLNGFADGVAYVPAKDGNLYALNLTTGALLWRASLGSYGGVPSESLSTAALDRNNVVVGTAAGATDFNATTGGVIWTYQTPVNSQIVPAAPAEVIASPAISGPAGSEVVSFCDLGGAFRVLSLATGKQLYQHQTGSWITGSPAVSNGDVLFGSTDGYLYDMSAGSGNQAPVTTITSPPYGSVVGNPRGNYTVSGTATGSAGVASVVVGVRQGGNGGDWWNPVTSSWSATPVTEHASLTAPGTTATGWSVSFPVTPSGNAYRIDAYAVAVNGPPSVPAVGDEFFVGPTADGATLGSSRQVVGPNGVVAVRGTGYGPGEVVHITMLGRVVATVTAQADGSFPATATVTIPATEGFGPTALIATGATTGKSAAESIYIANKWTGIGGDAGHTGYEPFDPVIDNTIDPGQGILLNPAWHYSTGTASGAPVIADDVAYVGDRAGTLRALRVRDGSPIWSWSAPSGVALSGAPAVDSTAGLAFVGGADGKLYAVHTSGALTGKLAWAAAIGTSAVQPPVFDGTTVYAGSSRVEALAEATGAVTWSVSTASPVTAAPSLDGGRLVIPISGAIGALIASTGAPAWTFTVPGPTAPVICKGVVYLGSSDKRVYAISAASGKQLWATATGGAVQDSGALTFTATGAVAELWIGSSDGSLYALNAASGAKDFTFPLGSSTRGVAVAGNTALVATASGQVIGVRTKNGDAVVWDYQTRAGVLSPPAVNDGTMFVAGQTGTVWALTPYGQPPA